MGCSTSINAIAGYEEKGMDKYFKPFFEIFDTKKCMPMMLRATFHEAGTYDATDSTGGCTGGICTDEELGRPENKGIEIAVNVCK